MLNTSARSAPLDGRAGEMQATTASHQGGEQCLRKHIDDLNRKDRAAPERVRAGTTRQCVRVPGAAGESDEAGARADVSGAAEVAAESLIGIVADADEVRARLIACQQYIRGATAQ